MLLHMGCACSAKEITWSLGEDSIQCRLTRLSAKLGVCDRMAVVTKALSRKWISLEDIQACETSLQELAAQLL